MKNAIVQEMIDALELCKQAILTAPPTAQRKLAIYNATRVIAAAQNERIEVEGVAI